MELEIGLVWAAVILYAATAVLSWIALIWRSDRVLGWVTPGLGLAVSVHAVPITLRWIRIGHGPYISTFEVLSSAVWVGCAMLLGACLLRPTIRNGVGFVVGVSIMFLGWGVLSNPEVQPLPASFKGVWLLVHIAFAKLAFGSILVATGAAFLYFQRSSGATAEVNGTENKADQLRELDDFASRLVTLGFVAMTFMIVAGALWARNSWGRYWSWDPIETWALITWVAYGLFLHLRLGFKVRGRASAALILILFLLTVFSLFVIVGISPTIHTEFMIQ